MKRRLYKRARVPTIPTASMADIAFLLIIFFMLTTTFSPDRTNVALPQSMTREQVSQTPAIVAITVDGEMAFSDGERESRQVSGAFEVGQLAEEVVSSIPNKEFVVKADRGVRYQEIDEVLEELRKAGVRNIGLLTNQRMARLAAPDAGENP